MSVTRGNATHTPLASVRDAFVGRTASGARVFVSIDVQHVTVDAPHQTTDHQPITEWDEVSITAGLIEKGSGQRRDWDACGQLHDEIRHACQSAGTAWTKEDRASLRELLAWHLNGTRAACAHDVPEWEESRYGGPQRVTGPKAHRCTAPQLDETGAPVLDADGLPRPSGYRYGSAWLVRPLPAALRDEAVRLTGLPVGKRPAWVGDSAL